MRILVIGAAVSGRAVVRLAGRLGHRATVYDADPAAANALLAEGAAAVGGAWDPRLLDGMDVVVTSPGVPERSAPIVDALEAGLAVWSEIEYASRHLEGVPLVAVTGTNGKTTTTLAISRMLTGSGLDAPALGNIGTPLSDIVRARRRPDVGVVETSSFQLRFIETFRPRVAVFLNLAPDHLDVHGDLYRYGAAKARIFENQGPEDLLVHGDAPEVLDLVERAAARRIPVSGTRRPRGGLGPDGDALHLGRLRLPLADLPTSDPAYLLDLTAAAAAALEMGANPTIVAQVIRTFRPAEHRRSTVASIGDVTFVDDSKATNPHAAIAAIAAYPSVVLIAGGRAKGLDLSPLAAHPHVRHVVAIGESAPHLLAAAEAAGRPAESAPDMDEAVRRAAAAARPGDTVLLAPGAASFDMFSGYAERGEAFASAVRRLAPRPAQGGRTR